jgi:hypothetical protein
VVTWRENRERASQAIGLLYVTKERKVALNADAADDWHGLKWKLHFSRCPPTAASFPPKLHCDGEIKTTNMKTKPSEKRLK